MTKMTEEQKSIRKAEREAERERQRIEQDIQNRKDKLVRDLEDLRIQMARFPDRKPTLTFKVGEVIEYGAINKTTILEILDEGRILRVHVYHVNGKDSRDAGKISADEERYLPWYDVNNVKHQGEIFYYSDMSRFQYMQRDISSLVHCAYYFGINMTPDYQRDLVWTLEDKVKLIDSIFNYVDIGKFSFIQLDFVDRSGPLYEILDGKQRINALLDFYEGRFKYRGKTYHEMHCRDQAHFDHYSVSWAETTEQLTPEQKYRYFLRLNTGGQPQDPAHIEYVRSLLAKSAQKS